jgi:hypothetical protein
MTDSVIRRSIGGTIAAGAASLAIAAGAVAAFTNDNWVLGVIAALVAVVLGVVAFVGPQKAKCPTCGASMSADSPSVNHCAACGQYARAESGALVKLTPDYIHARGVFPVHLDRLIKPGFITGLPTTDMRDVRWPNICIACNAAATGTDPVEVFVTRISGPVQNRLRLRFPFPHCAKHRVGADMTDGEVWHGNGFECDHVQLRFQSYRYWLEFCRLNSIDQRRAQHPK